MPELTAHSIPTLHRLPPSLYAAPPDDPPAPRSRRPRRPGSLPPPSTAPRWAPSCPPCGIDPAAWEDFAVFRETFLMYLTPPGYAAAFRTVGEMLSRLDPREAHDPWPGWPKSSTRTEFRAAVADLRHLEGFLGAVGREHAVSSLTRPDERLSRFAARQAAEVAKIAHRIEAELAKPTSGEPRGGVAMGWWGTTHSDR